MKENEHEYHPHGHFWSGFFLGAILGSGSLFLFGTKRGREAMQKILDTTENLDDAIADILKDVGEDIKERKDSTSTVDLLEKHIPGEEKLTHIAGRIKNVFLPKVETKKERRRKKKT